MYRNKNIFKKRFKKNLINYLLDYFNVDKIFNEDFVNTSPGNFGDLIISQRIGPRC